MNKPQDLFALAQAAIQYAQAVADTAHCKEVLRGGYMAWRITTGNQHTDLTRGDANWQAMMRATTTIPIVSTVRSSGAMVGSSKPIGTQRSPLRSTGCAR